MNIPVILDDDSWSRAQIIHVVAKFRHVDEMYHIDATIVIIISLHVSGIYMPIFRGTLYATTYGVS
jgi:hypothetical protein